MNLMTRRMMFGSYVGIDSSSGVRGHSRKRSHSQAGEFLEGRVVSISYSNRMYFPMFYSFSSFRMRRDEPGSWSFAGERGRTFSTSRT